MNGFYGLLWTLARFGVAGWAFLSLSLPKPFFNRQPTQVAQPDKPKPEPIPFSVLKPTKGEIQFLTNICPPLREPIPQRCEILTDLHCRLSNPKYWADPNDPGDLITLAHEQTHGVSNRLHASTERHGIYLGGGKGIVLKHPKVTITQVAVRVPKAERGKVFDLYMVKQAKQWDDSPIYILDEARAYYHGCVAHKQLGYGKHRSETFEFAKEMQRYSEYLVKTVRELDPSYPEMLTLEKFVQWQGEQLAALGGPNDGR